MNFTLSVMVLLAGFMGMIYVAAGKTIGWKKQVPVMMAVAATAVRLWLTLDQRLIVEGNAGHDAYLFVWQAAHIIEGLWLGEYNYLTLIKGPFLSIWMAFMFWLGVPFLLSLHLLYVACSALMVLAMQPVTRSRWAALGLYLLLLFNPMSYTIQTAAVISRMGIYQALTLGIAACCIGLYLRSDHPLGRRICWAGALGALLGCFLVTREAGIWIFPMLAILAAGHLWNSRGDHSVTWLNKASPLILVAFLAFSAVQGVSYINWKNYGMWGVTEFGHPSFSAAYGALSRIKPVESIPYVPVTRASRVKAYSASPAFATLERHLEGDVGQTWAAPGRELVGLPVERREIAGGWFMWALREAAMWQEYHVWPSRAMEYYQLVSDEINEACDSGVLDCYQSRATFAPVWRSEWKLELARAFGNSLVFLAGFRAYASSLSPSYGKDWVVEMFSEVTRTRTVPREGDMSVYSTAENLYQFKRRHLNDIAQKYKDLSPLLVGLSLVVLIAVPVLRVRVGRDNIRMIVAPAIALLAALGAYCLLLSLVEISSFNTFRQYLFQANALLLIVMFLSLCLAVRLIRGNGPTRELDL